MVEFPATVEFPLRNRSLNLFNDVPKDKEFVVSGATSVDEKLNL
jgi:hypothetical protein